MKSKTIAMLAVILTLSTASDATPPVPAGPGFLPGDALVQTAPLVQETPVVAAGGSGFLAVWTDLRTDDSQSGLWRAGAAAGFVEQPGQIYLFEK